VTTNTAGDHFTAWQEGGPCLCWWQSSPWLHEGHCCFRDGWSETGPHCHEVPADLKSLPAAQTEGA
jgi:hypothetical protein